MILELEQEICKMSLGYLIVPESIEGLKDKQTKNPTWIGFVQGTHEPTGRVPSGQSWNNLINKINRVVLDYNPKYKLNIHESILKQTT